MPELITIAPVTRIEGHAKITIHLNAKGEVEDARFHVNEFRGFEKFCEGRLVWEMPGLTSRICGICPASHLVTSAKAGDDILAIGIPETAEKLRRMLTLAQWIQSHALSFFHLSSPDFLLGFEADPALRNIFGLLQHNKEFTRKGIRLRKFGQQIIEFLGGRRIHTPWAVAGGVREPFTKEERDKLLEWYPEVRETALLAVETIKKIHDTFKKEIPAFGNFHSLFVGLVGPKGELEYYGGNLRIMDSTGNIIADNIDPRKYYEHFGEASESWSYLKFPYYKPLGYPKGIYRVGPLARLNICNRIETPLAEQERKLFKKLAPTTESVNNSFYYHYARLIELLFAVEKVEELLHDPIILGTHVRSKAEINRLEGVGAAEAPRGTLFHHYWVDENGVLKKVNMLIATAQNNMAMNRTVRQIATHFLDGRKITEPMLNRIEAGIRCFDPCLSCSTHAAGQMPLHVQMVDADGYILDEVRR
ncbi:MAG: Ni/Fe hydrogenase subunit alpha [Ignavibacteriales bacterium]|nr:Ni/Fe hydrogenase subunit alpha [Ignavibacteriales bacterium]